MVDGLKSGYKGLEMYVASTIDGHHLQSGDPLVDEFGGPYMV